MAKNKAYQPEGYKQYAGLDKENDVELGSEFQIGNSASQSQKKSGRQMNKQPGSL